MSTIHTRFFGKFKESPSCWEWLAYRDRKGYGRFMVPGSKTSLAHRFSWELHRGPIPTGMCVLHRCDNPPCVNPAHLFLGTLQDNVRDMIQKGRGSNGNRAITHCPSGHAYNSENTYQHNGRRSCKECSRSAVRKRRSLGAEQERARARELYHANLEEARRKGREKARARCVKKRSTKGPDELTDGEE